MITHYDLFAGIGGFSYALDRVFYDQQIKHIFCEWEAFPTAVLKKHWPDATYYGDIADLVADTDSQRLCEHSERKRPQSTPSGTRDRVGEELIIVTGGFPCQPFSHAGRRKGTADDRYKWPEMFAVIRNVKPDWVIAENVRGFATWNDGMVLGTVCTDLESEGYEVQPFIIPACAVGAPHQRERVWIVAHAFNSGQGGAERESAATSDSIQKEYRTQDGTTWKPERADSDGTNNESNGKWQMDWREVALTTCYDGVDDGLSYRLHGATSRGKRTDVISASQHRKERLKACGNAIVPQVAMELFRAIGKNEGLDAAITAVEGVGKK